MRLMRFLSRWTSRRRAKLSHANALARLVAAGFAPRVVYDVGAYRGGWSKAAAEVLPPATFILFEANADNAPYLAETGHRYFITALSDKDTAERQLFLPRTGDSTGSSLYIENTSHYASAQRAYPPPRQRDRGARVGTARPHENRCAGRGTRRDGRRDRGARGRERGYPRNLLRDLQQGCAIDRGHFRRR